MNTLEETFENIEWLAKTMIHVRVGGDIEVVWKEFSRLYPKAVENARADAREIMRRIREREKNTP